MGSKLVADVQFRRNLSFGLPLALLFIVEMCAVISQRGTVFAAGRRRKCVSGRTPGRTITFVVGDDDLLANGNVVDQGGPAAQPLVNTIVDVPTPSDWDAILLSWLPALLGLTGPRRRVRCTLD